MSIVQIDMSGHLPAVGYDEGEIRERVFTIAEMARSEWVRQAQYYLGSSAVEYINGIQPVQMKENWAAVRLVGQLPNDIERGKPPFDMKPGLLVGPNAKMGKTGRYNTVPFRHGTPGSTGKRVGAPMPITHTTAKGRPASIVYTEAKRLRPSVEGPAGKTVWGGRTGDFDGLGVRTQLPVKKGRPGAYTWKTSPFASMTKVAKTYAKATQNQYVTFRRVSENSDPNSWWHPGFKPRNLVNRVRDYINDIVKRLI